MSCFMVTSRPALHTVPATVLKACRHSFSPYRFQNANLLRLEYERPFSSGPHSQPSAFPVVLLSGFLGAGKTTVLEQLLRQQHGFKLGVIVNDLASVNVDANLLRDAITNSGTESVSLENGCVCCTAKDDLHESVQSLITSAESKGLDAIVVELSGVAEPAEVKQALENPAQSTPVKQSKPVSVRTVTLVDSPAFATDYLKERTPHSHHAHNSSGECDERYGTLLAEQVESADMLLLNKSDIATEKELVDTHTMVRALNASATMRTTQYGKVLVDEFLDLAPDTRTADRTLETVPASLEAAPEVVKACCAAKTCSSTNKESTQECGSTSKTTKAKSRAETRFGITSFVYTTSRMMSRMKLMKALGEWQQAREQLGDKLSLLGLNNDSTQAATNAAKVGGKRAADVSPLGPILRSKGKLFLDVNPKVAFLWSHAGKSVNFSPFGVWTENEEDSRGMSGWDAKLPQNVKDAGARETELVFIGAGYDEIAIRDLLDSCLLTDIELKKYFPNLAS